MASITQDNRASSTMTADSRTAVGTLTQDARAYFYLWSAETFPWLLALPWQITVIGSTLTQDART